jgi:translation initiation factor 2 alpha subunit (eIF-2alpha)
MKTKLDRKAQSWAVDCAFAQYGGQAFRPTGRPLPEKGPHMSPEEKTKPVMDLFEQAMRNYEQALKTGLRFQEESSRLWTGLLGQSAAPADWQKRVKTMTDEFLPQAEKSLEESLKVVEQNSRAGVELMKKAIATAQATSAHDAQTKFLSFWEASLGALRDNAAAVTQANSRTAETWMKYVRKSSEHATGPAGKA